MKIVLCTVLKYYVSDGKLVHKILGKFKIKISATIFISGTVIPVVGMLGRRLHSVDNFIEEKCYFL